MDEFNFDELKDYDPLFEIGLIKQINPAIKVVGSFEIKPTTLAALCTGIFEAVMRTVPENQQIEFEDTFNKAFKVLMDERYNYDVVYKGLPGEDGSDEE